MAVFVGFGEAAVKRLLPQQPDNLRAVRVEDDDRDAKREVFEVLAHPEEVRRQVVVHEEVIYLLLDVFLSCFGVVDQAAAVAHLCIKELAC